MHIDFGFDLSIFVFWGVGCGVWDVDFEIWHLALGLWGFGIWD